jgi:hypothetical protein
MTQPNPIEKTVCPYCPPVMSIETTPGAKEAFKAWHEAGHPKTSPTNDPIESEGAELDVIAREMLLESDFITEEYYQEAKAKYISQLQSLLNKARLEELKTVANVETSAAQDNEFSDGYLEGFNAMRRIVENRIDELEARLKSKGAESK